MAVYERYVTTPAAYRIMEDGTWLPATYYRLGELHEARGERAKAAEYYGRFISLWKGADAPLQPRVTEARRRLQSLVTESGD